MNTHQEKIILPLINEKKLHLSKKRYFSHQHKTTIYWLCFIIILIAGAFLRTQQLTTQWLIDDEWHTLHKIMKNEGYLSILSSFGYSDYSIPLTIYNKFIADHFGLSELRMRLPMLLSGFIFIFLSIFWINRRFGRAIALSYGLLVATSPLLINYSRNARPYMITLLLVTIAIWSLSKWAQKGELKQVFIYCSTAWLAAYLHPITAPFVLSPFAIIAYYRLQKNPAIHCTWLQLFVIGLITTILIMATILPPLINDMHALTVKTGTDTPQIDTIIGVLYIWLGTKYSTVVFLGLILAVYGWSHIRRNATLELSMWLSGLFGILLAIYVLQPAWVHNPLTFGRYLLSALPLWLLLMSAGIHRLTTKISASLFTQKAVTAIITFVFLIGSPHADLLQKPNNFTLHSYYQFDYRPNNNPVRQAFASSLTPSPFWARFEHANPAQYRIAIFGSPSFESYFNLQPLYQPYHRQLLLNLQIGGACHSAPISGEAYQEHGIHLRNAVSLAHDDLKEKQIDWIVLDRRMVNDQQSKTKETLPITTMLNACSRYLTQHLGTPDYIDANLQAYKID